MNTFLTYDKGPNLVGSQLRGLVQEAAESLARKSGLQLLGIFVVMVSYH